MSRRRTALAGGMPSQSDSIELASHSESLGLILITWRGYGRCCAWFWLTYSRLPVPLWHLSISWCLIPWIQNGIGDAPTHSGGSHIQVITKEQKEKWRDFHVVFKRSWAERPVKSWHWAQRKSFRFWDLEGVSCPIHRYSPQRSVQRKQTAFDCQLKWGWLMKVADSA